MAGTVTVTESSFAGVSKIRWAWTSTAGGAADKVTVSAYYGEVLALVTIPDGTAVPTNLYDLTVTDAEGYDVLQAVGADRSSSATETANPTKKTAGFGTLTLNVTNAGNAKSGVAILYILGRKVG